ncbi:MAG: SusD/RagB family nutrient-binding outer membrane lipoprotein [Bacteroidales bacterium]|nr:SusD/RagB family nutrient-binding outer membrane lipoprotein [Bacteroidales bacterium]
MKNIKNNIWVLLVVLFLGSCTSEYLDINDDPNNPTEAVMDQLLSGGEYYMTQGLGQGNFIGNSLSSYVHQLVSREVQNYGMTAGANGTFNTWNYLYTYALPAYDAIIEAGEKDGNLIYVGVAKTLRAYTFSMMVDLWGDIPYSEFNIPGINAPKPDNSKDIYNSLLALLEEAQADLVNEDAVNNLKPGTDDFFYGGDVDKWTRLNNTIQLKLLVQSRKAKSDITDWQVKLTGLMTKNKFIKSGEDFQFWFNTGTSPQDMRHPAISEYTGQQTYYISPYFYETMAGDTYNTVDNPFAGIEDPRVPYYFVNQLKTGKDSENSHEYRNGNFMSIFFATNGNNASGSNDKSLTKIGIYPAGGKYDDGKGGAVTLAAVYGEAPHKMVTFFSLKFMLAELVLEAEITGDARALFEDAVFASLNHVNSVAKKQTGVPLIDVTDSTFVDDILAKYDAADADGKMRIVMTQKWIANFFNPIDIYTDYRRTGYPLLFDPAKTADPGNGVNPTVEENSPAEVPLMNIASFPRSLYYPTNSETELNANINQKVNLSTPFLFWDKN